MSTFKLQTEFEPAGDQIAAIAKLVEGLENGEAWQTLLGVTGSGKTFTMANIIMQTGRPAIVMAHNKTLAAQLYSEFRDFFPENSVEFYKPLVDWLEAYKSNPLPHTKVNIQLEYFNTSSSKCILDVFKKLEAINKGDKAVEINWYYEEDDEDMLEAGEDYESIIQVPFNMLEVTE